MNNHKKSALAAACALALAALGTSQSARAGEAVVFDNGVQLDWRLSTIYTLSSRVGKPSGVLSGTNNAGGNDGDNNFRKGALTADRLAAVLETKLSKGDSGFVLSGSGFYDDAYHHDNDNRFAINDPGPVDRFAGGTRKYHGGYARVLDAYGYTAFDAGAAGKLNVRLGQQVVSWGEALFFPSISLAQGPADGTKVGIPGTQTKDQLLPEDQIAATLQVNDAWTLMSYAQFHFHETLAPAPGSYLSTSDSVGPGATCLGPYTTIPAVGTLFPGFSGCSFGARQADIRPGKLGQFGVGTRYRLTEATELGLYFLNYDDRTPLPEINAFSAGTAIPAALQSSFGGLTQIGNGTYRIRYFDNVKLIGTSFSTTLGVVAVAGELSHKIGAPVLINALVNPATGATIATPTRADITQANLNAFYNIGRTPLADSAQLLGEVSYVHIDSVQARKAVGSEAYPAAYGFTASDALNFRAHDAVAVSSTLALSYPGVAEGWDLSVPINVAYQVRGRTLTGGVGGQGDLRYSVGGTVTRQGNLSVGLTYQGYAGGASVDSLKYRPLADRDQVSMVVGYAF